MTSKTLKRSAVGALATIEVWLTAVVLCAAATTASAQDAKTALEKAQTKMGTLRSLKFSGTGTNGRFGQALAVGKEWPRRELDSVKGEINYEQKSAKIELRIKPAFGGQRQVAIVNGDKAWTVGPTDFVPQLAAAPERQLQIWMTPHGFLRAAMAATNATARSANEGGKPVTVVSFTAMDKYRLSGTIDADGLVTKVETTFPDAVLGDMPYQFTYSDYKDFGVQFPTRIVHTAGGFMVNDFTITAVEPNAPVDIPVAETAERATIVPPRVESTKVADGVWFVGGGSHHSVVVEFSNFITVIEAPQNDERSKAVIAEAKKLVPNKPIKYVVSTHHHFDHSGGLRTYVAEGSTVVTHASNKAYWEKSFMAPALLSPDSQSKARRKPSIQAVTDKYVISDGKQTVEVYSTTGDTHTEELLIAYIPSAKAVVEADSYSPGPPNAPVPNPPPPNAVVLHDNIERLKLDVTTVIGVHGRGPVPIAEFKRFVGKS